MISEAQKRATAKYKKDKVDAVIFSFDKKILFRFKKPWKQVANQRHHMFVMQ